MNSTGCTDTPFESGGAILARAPVTPEGAEMYRQTFTAALPDEPEGLSVLAAIYNQSADEWLADWRTTVSELPIQSALIDVGGKECSTEARSSDAHRVTDSVSIIPTAPTDPAKVLFALREQLEQSVTSGRDVVVSIESLTAFLDSVDKETAFRYLNLLIHELRATGSIGYFHIDPNAHSQHTIDTISVLFDSVVDCPPDDHDQPPRPREDHDTGTPPNTANDASSLTAPPSATNTLLGRLREQITSVIGRFGTHWRSNRVRPLRSEPQHSAAQPETVPSGFTKPDTGSVSDETLLTTDEQIYQLLYQHDGRMKQREIVEQTPWSASTVSQALSEMEEAQQIQRVQIGRGKIVFLAGQKSSEITPVIA